MIPPTNKVLALLFSLSVAAHCSFTFAHHSLVGEFDVETEFELHGTLTRVEWFNPHIWFYLDVVNAKGETEKWQCEMGSPNQLIRSGWKKEALPIGTVIRAKAYRARDGSNTCSSRNITLDNGASIFNSKL